MFAIMGHTANGPEPESHCQTIQAANNRLKMLKKYHPQITFWIQPVEDLAETLVMEGIS